MDRNHRVGNIPLHIVGSLSARRAWIEIVIAAVFSLTTVLSLSARRAWIEISKIMMLVFGLEKVALRKESVDRNVISLNYKEVLYSRSPQGERG